MGVRRWGRLAAAAIAAACIAPTDVWAQGVGRGRATAPGQLKKLDNRADYNRGYERGLRDGEQDARRNRRYDAAAPNTGRRPADVDFRNGYADGYRTGYYQYRNTGRPGGVLSPRTDRRDGVLRRAPGGYQEPASARGYSDGYEDGLKDGRDRKGYDPVGEKDYRSADNGYYSGYGSKDAYKNNYRAGFRQGYEDGYRAGGVQRR